MRVIEREVVYTGKYLRVVRKSFLGDSETRHFWETVERTNVGTRGAVVVIALTKKNEVILERNWRVPTESFVIQLPAGLCDSEGESQEDTARRELLEETGYLASKLIPVMVSTEDPALTSTQIHHFLAPDVEFTGNVRSDGTEDIEVLKVPVAGLADFLLHLPDDTMLDLRVAGIVWILERMKII